MTFTEDDEDAYFVRRDELVSDFDAWAHTSGIADFAGAEDFGTLLDWKWGYADGRLDIWRLGDIEEFLLEWCPRKIAAPAELVRGIPSAVTLGMSFLATHELLSARSDPLERLTEFTMELQGRFMEAMDNPANFGMGKSLLGGLGIDDLSSMDPEQLENAIEAFNALPQEERLRITGGDDNAAPLPTIGPIGMPEESAVHASAAAAPALRKFEQLNAYFAAPGRQLTAAGNLKLADAHALTELLETGDIAEQEIGDKIWRKRSATRFVQLDHWQWWAREAGALQRRGNKLVGVKAWRQRLAKDPVAQATRAFQALLDFGALASFRPWYYTRLMQVLDESVGPLLGQLLNASGPAEYDALLDAWTTMTRQVGVSDSYPGEVARSFDELVGLLERAGVIEQDGAIHTPARYVGTDRTGGTIRLTPVGTVLAVDLVRDSGVTVNVTPDPASMSAGDLADLVGGASLDPPSWWDIAADWLWRQSDQSVAFTDLVHAIAEHNMAMLLITLDTAPESMEDVLVPVLRDIALSSDPPPAELGSVAAYMLAGRGKFGPEAIDRDRMVDAILISLGIFAEAGVFLAPEIGDTVDSQLSLIREAGRRRHPRTIALLEAIGRESTDKAVAKAARKELFRVRSRG